ncbi:response regulator [Brevundimonas sp.]|uniref:response regulator n=1 Tax=Brevundimonas sp. TaxID=1871086 RepID=UPI0028A044EF|nr:response regulator [Brevundimonas sp.]
MCHVLIIEDEAMVALDLQGILADSGATSFDIADTEASAVSQALARRPDFITSAVRLREGTGPCAVDRIRSALGEVPVVFVTGTPEECEPCEGDRVLTKPLEIEAIASVFRELAPV